MTDYEIERNKLISAAEKYADGMAGVKPGKEKLSVNARKKAWEIWNGEWNRAFHTRMVSLWKERLKKEGL